jgi:hypothetical protein
MKSMHSLAVLIATLVLVVTTAAQSTKPDFSGTWTMDPERSESIINDYEPGPVTLVVRQTPLDLIVETKRADSSETLVFKLDGSQTVHSGDVQTTARWEGASLVAKTVRRISGWAVTTEETWLVDTGRQSLTIQRALFVQHGYERGPRDPGYTSAKDVFVRAKGSF